MLKKSYYIDSCIWLNLFKKEGSPEEGIPYWKIAKDFIEKVMFSEDEEIVYSGLILKEIKYKLGTRSLFRGKELFLKEERKFRFVKVIKEDYIFARKLESSLSYELSFYDCLHLVICKRLGLTLITRDNNLIKIARKYIHVEKPENLLFS